MSEREYQLSYTASELEDKLASIDNKADLINGKVPTSQLPEKEEISWEEVIDKPTNLSDFTNDVGYLTKIPEEYITESDLNEKVYVTETELNNRNYLTHIPDEYITETELNTKGYITYIPENYITEEKLDLRGYITSIPSDYITEDELNNKGYITNIPEEYITENKLNGKGYLTEIPDEYITENELNSKGYITEHQDLSEYVKTSNLSSVATSGNYNDLNNKPNLSNVATSGNYGDLNDIPETFEPKEHNHDDVYYTETEINTKITDINTVLNALEDNKANIETINDLNQNIQILDSTTQKTSNLITSITSVSTDTEYPSAKAVYTELEKKQEQLTFDNELIDGSANPVSSGVVKQAVDNVIKIAAGKCATYIYESYADLLYALLGDEDGNGQDTYLLENLKSGDILLIRALNEPDFWWEEVKTRAMVRTNFEPEIIVNGYGVARILETTKTDLNGYAKIDDIPVNLSELNEDKDHRLVTDDEKTAWSEKSNFSGNYEDLVNKPIIPEQYIHPSTHSVDMITGLSSVATSGDFNDLNNKPNIPTEYTHPATHPASMITGLSNVATSGSYNDLDNKPTIPEPYVHPDTHPASMITNLATVATTGSYNDLKNKPTIPSAYTHPSTHPASMITGLNDCATSGNASKWGGYQIRTASEGDTGLEGYITFII